jgi:hypothetical protein
VSAGTSTFHSSSLSIANFDSSASVAHIIPKRRSFFSRADEICFAHSEINDLLTSFRSLSCSLPSSMEAGSVGLGGSNSSHFVNIDVYFIPKFAPTAVSRSFWYWRKLETPVTGLYFNCGHFSAFMPEFC